MPKLSGAEAREQATGKVAIPRSDMPFAGLPAGSVPAIVAGAPQIEDVDPELTSEAPGTGERVLVTLSQAWEAGIVSGPTLGAVGPESPRPRGERRPVHRNQGI